MAGIEIPDEQLHAIIATAMLSAIGGDARDKILTDAIRELLTKKPEYGSGRHVSKLQEAFSHAVEKIAREEAFKIIAADDTFRAKISELVRAGVEQAMADTRKITDRIAWAVGTAIAGTGER